jgi:F-type H+-transporting ATPase subunit g
MSIARIHQMASKAKTAAEPAYNIARTEVLKQYETLMANNKQYVLEKPEQANDMLKKWFYTKMSRLVAQFRSAIHTFRYTLINQAPLRPSSLLTPSLPLSLCLFLFLQSRIPAGIDQCQKEADFVKKRFAIWKELSATEAGMYVAFGAELFAWFCVGEIVGRGGSINGYNI